MNDVIWGEIIDAIDGNTFDMKITFARSANINTYNKEERIILFKKVHNRTAAQLKARLLDEDIRCTVLSRDPNGRLICDIIF